MAAAPPQPAFLPQHELPLSNRTATVLGTGITFHVLALFAIVLRYYVRFFIAHAPGWDDFWIGISFLFSTCAVVFMCIIMDIGLGQHFMALPLDKLERFSLVLYLGLGTFCLSAIFIKISIICQYLRIFDQGRIRILCFTTMVLTSLWGFAYAFIAWFPCFPVRATWDTSVKGKCYGFMSKNRLEFTMSLESHAATNMVLDILVLVIPMVLFTKRGLKRRQVLAMAGVFALGAVSCSLAIARLYVIAKAFSDPKTKPVFDMSWHAPISVLLSSLELSVALISSSIPVFWPVLVNLSFGQILAIHEVKITSEYRHRDEELDDINLHLSRASSIAGSERSLHHKTSKTPLTSEEQYYSDQFVATQVTPLGKKENYMVNVERPGYLDQMKILRSA